MSKLIRLVCHLLPVLAALVVVTGCRRAVLDLNDYRGEPTGRNVGVGGELVDNGPIFETGDNGTITDTTTEWPTEGGMGPLPGDNAGGTVAPKRWLDSSNNVVAVYFAYDSAAVGPTEMPKIKTLAEHMIQNATYGVVVEGHCDERGSDEYNRALAQQRAIVVRDHLCAQGVAESRIETVSYGEDRPAVANATGEGGHQKNRRAEFLLGLLK